MEPGWFTDWFTPRGMVTGSRLNKVWEGYNLSETSQLKGKSAFDIFFDFLSHPGKIQWQDMALVYALALHADRASAMPSSWKEDLACLPPGMDEGLTSHTGERIVGGPQWNDLPGITCYACSDRVCVKKHHDKVGIVAILEDPDDDAVHGVDAGFEAIWNGFLRAYNLLQFLPNTLFFTRKGLKNHQYDGLVLSTSHNGFTPSVKDDLREETGPHRAADTAVAITQEDGAWNEVRELVNEALADLTCRLENCKASVPVVGEEFEDQRVVLGELELAWNDRQVGVYDADNTELKAALSENGWQLFTIDQVILHPDEMISAVVPSQ